MFAGKLARQVTLRAASRSLSELQYREVSDGSSNRVQTWIKERETEHLMKFCAALVVFSGYAVAAEAETQFTPDFYNLLKENGSTEQAFNYALAWAGSSNQEAETAVAYALLDGIGVEPNPYVAIAMACRSTTMDEFDVSRILIQGNLRLAKKDFQPIKCDDEAP